MHKQLPKLDLNITNSCNFRCVHCAFDSGVAKMSELSVSELEKVLKDTKGLGGERIDITGGEPTTRKDLDEIIRLGKSLGYKIELVTNGSLLRKDRLSKLRNLGLDSVAISLDGSSYDNYSRIRKVDEKTYKRVLQTIKDSVSLGFYTKVNTVVFESNLEELPSIAELCIKEDVNELGIYYFTPVGRGNRGKELAVEPVKWLNFIRENLVKYGSEIKISLEFPVIEKEFSKNGIGCILQEDPYHLQILPDGNVYPCAILASYFKPLANLHKNSVREIWNNEEVWDKYLQRIKSEVFQKFSGFCVDFHGFDLEQYKSGRYRFVCPLRKFDVNDLVS